MDGGGATCPSCNRRLFPVGVGGGWRGVGRGAEGRGGRGTGIRGGRGTEDRGGRGAGIIRREGAGGID